MVRDSAILLTPAGAAAVAVVRLSGPGTAGFLRAHFSKPAKPGRAVHGELLDGGRVIDDPVVVASAGGAVADVNLHGGPWVVRSVLELARREGFDLVRADGPGLPDWAVDGEGESEREVLTHLPRARTELGVRVLLAQPAAWGRFERAVAEAEVAGGTRPRELSQWLERVSRDRCLERLLDPPRVAVAGGANVGKSTLANQLFAQERSITADLPGTTRDWVGEIADVSGLAVLLVDTPGLRETTDAIEAAAIARAGEQIEAADLVVLVLDATQPLAPQQAALRAAHPAALTVVNKIDRPPARDAAGGLPPGAVRTIATTGEGVEALRREIARRLGCDAVEIDQPRCWTPRQRRWIERALARD